MIKGYGFFEDCEFSKRWANVFFNWKILVCMFDYHHKKLQNKQKFAVTPCQVYLSFVLKVNQST